VGADHNEPVSWYRLFGLVPRGNDPQELPNEREVGGENNITDACVTVLPLKPDMVVEHVSGAESLSNASSYSPEETRHLAYQVDLFS